MSLAASEKDDPGKFNQKITVQQRNFSTNRRSSYYPVPIEKFQPHNFYKTYLPQPKKRWFHTKFGPQNANVKKLLSNDRLKRAGTKGLFLQKFTNS